MYKDYLPGMFPDPSAPRLIEDGLRKRMRDLSLDPQGSGKLEITLKQLEHYCGINIQEERARLAEWVAKSKGKK